MRAARCNKGDLQWIGTVQASARLALGMAWEDSQDVSEPTGLGKFYISALTALTWGSTPCTRMCETYAPSTPWAYAQMMRKPKAPEPRTGSIWLTADSIWSRTQRFVSSPSIIDGHE